MLGSRDVLKHHGDEEHLQHKDLTFAITDLISDHLKLQTRFYGNITHLLKQIITDTRTGIEKGRVVRNLRHQYLLSLRLSFMPSDSVSVQISASRPSCCAARKKSRGPPAKES